MLYEQTRDMLNSFPPPRIRVHLKNGGTLETPRSQMATASKKHFVLSVDGVSLRRLQWDEIESVEPVTLITHR